MSLRSDIKLVRPPNLRVVLERDRSVLIETAAGTVDGGPLGLEVIEAFAQPLSIGEALEELKPRLASRELWLQVAENIRRLHEAGVLCEADSARQLHHRPGFLDSPDIHTAMLDDRSRTDGFLKALRQTVKPTDVVLDIGTGTGVLAIAAAQAGARHVYAIEGGQIAAAAREVIEANGYSERITLINDWSTHIELPERADVLVTEIIGTEPLGEGVLESMSDARRRLLKPDATMIPRRLRVFALPLEIPHEWMDERTFTQRSVQRWQEWYDIDFSPLVEFGNASAQDFMIKPFRVRDWKQLSEPVLLTDLDLQTAESSTVAECVSVSANAAGELNGVLVYFETELADDLILSTAPDKSDVTNSWASHMWIASAPRTVTAGESFQLAYHHGVSGKRDGVHILPADS